MVLVRDNTCFSSGNTRVFFFYLHGGEEVGATRVLVVRQDIEELPDKGFMHEQLKASCISSLRPHALVA